MDFKKFSRLIMIEQTFFALPFAYIGTLFAGGGTPWTWLWVTLALVSARVAGMSFNRFIDRDIDRKNPRTSNRHLPRGEVSPGEVLLIAVVSSALLVFSSWMLNTLCFYLSFAAVALLVTYSYFKRFTSSSHYYLGIIEAAAPVGGYIAVTAEFTLVAIVLGAAIMFWIAGLDIVYALQDTEFDRREGLFSLPARFGGKRALQVSLVSYVLSFTAMAGAGIITARSTAYWVAVACIGIIFFRQQRLARSENVEEAILEFFSINRYISPILLVGTFIDVFIKP